MPKESAVAESASTWMQVAFGGLGLSAAIVGVVIAYLAWVQPHSPADDRKAGDDKQTVAVAQAPATSAGGAITTPAAQQVPLGSLTPTTGGGNFRPDGTGLAHGLRDR